MLFLTSSPSCLPFFSLFGDITNEVTALEQACDHGRARASASFVAALGAAARLPPGSVPLPPPPATTAEVDPGTSAPPGAEGPVCFITSAVQTAVAALQTGSRGAAAQAPQPQSPQPPGSPLAAIQRPAPVSPRAAWAGGSAAVPSGAPPLSPRSSRPVSPAPGAANEGGEDVSREVFEWEEAEPLMLSHRTGVERTFHLVQPLDGVKAV